MCRSPDMQALRAHEGEVLDSLVAALDCLNRGPSVLLSRFDELRNRVGATLQAYQQLLHSGLFERACQSGDAHLQTLAQRMKAASVSASLLFDNHVSQWDQSRIVMDWSHYEPSVRQAIDELRAQISDDVQPRAELVAHALATYRLLKLLGSEGGHEQ